MREHVRVIQSCADSEGPRSRTTGYARTAFAILGANASERAGFQFV
jgi:hypothetical protein